MRRLKLFFNDFAKHLFVGREIGDQLAEPGVRLHPNALDLYCQGMAWFNKGFSPDGTDAVPGHSPAVVPSPAG